MVLEEEEGGEEEGVKQSKQAVGGTRGSSRTC